MNEKGEVALDKIGPMAEFLLSSGVAGVFVCGTTGEGVSLSTDERKAVAKEWVDRAQGRLWVCVHVGHQSVREAADLAAHSEAIGADAVAAMFPSIFRIDRAAELVSVCRDIASASPRLPFFYYHMPALTGLRVPASEFAAEAEGRIPNFKGIKFTHEDLADFDRCRRIGGGRLEMMWGRDEMLLGALAMGATAAVGSTYNYVAPVYHAIAAALARGDLEAARTYQSSMIDSIRVVAKFGGIRAQKALMSVLGIECGPVRLPLTTLSREELSGMVYELESIGFFRLRESLSNARSDLDTGTR